MMWRLASAVRAPAGLALCTLAMLAACGQPRGPSSAQLKAGAMALDRAGASADPGLVAARDIAFSKAAREDGQWPAFASFAASDALLDTPDGFLTPVQMVGMPAPENPLNWWPTAVWSSCDGSLAVSFGRFTQGGKVGSYATAWTREQRDEYRWTFETTVLDDPQPLPRDGEPLPGGDDVIVVDALNMINARTADCPRGEAIAEAPEISGTPGGQSALSRAADGTLQWFRDRSPAGDRRMVVDYLRDGVWERALDLEIPAGG